MSALGRIKKVPNVVARLPSEQWMARTMIEDKRVFALLLRVSLVLPCRIRLVNTILTWCTANASFSNARG